MGTAGILFVGLISMVVIYGALRTAQKAMHEVADVEEPTSAAAYEMEINVIGTGLGVLKYLDTGDPQYRDRVEKDEADFGRFKARYDQLAETPEGKELGIKIGALFQEFVQLGRDLMDKRDERETLFRSIAGNFRVIDEILDDEIQENLNEGSLDGFQKVMELAKMEANIAEVGTWLGNYLQDSVPEFREKIFADARDFRKHLVRFKRLRLSRTERQSTAKLEKLFSQTLSLIQKDLALHDGLQEQVRRFLALREEMDYVLDEEIQALTMKDLNASKQEADAAHGNVIRSISLLLPAFLLLGVAVALVLIRTITEPLGKLIKGTSAVAAGDLSHRVSQKSQDEFADVAQKFNLMVTKLEETTVSKERLAVSEEELMRANIGLRNQIAERERVEKALGTSEERFRELFENANDIVYTLDLAGRFTSLNKAGEQATGYTRAEALTMNIEQIVAPEDLQRVRLMMKQEMVGRGPSPTYEFKIVTKDGRPLVLEVSARPIVQDGKPVGMQGIARDVTERKQLEAQFRQAQKMEAVGRLAGGVAHDFNNLLMVVRGYSEMSLARLGPHESLRTNLEEIQKVADRAASLTQQLLAFSRQQVLQPKVLDLNTVVTDAEKMLRRLIGEDIEVVTELAPELGPVKSDPGRIEQIILNLAVNGRDAMPQGGRLTLKTSNVTLDEAFVRRHVDARPGPHVLLAVSDTGTGMDAETRSHIFEPFFTTKGPDKGTGLGLSTVYGIVKQSGGYISVESAPGRGTTIEIYLPLVEKVAAGGELHPSVFALPPRGRKPSWWWRMN